MSSVAFRTARFLDSALRIPPLGWQDRIYLVRTNGVSHEALRAGGARRDENGWYVTRDLDILLDPLDAFLPQMARRVIIPNVVDLIPETSWCASLANMLAPKSWEKLRNRALERAEGCEDCGTRERLECHEMWRYDEETGVQRLEALRSVCCECHETYHLGLASVRGRYSAAFARLMLINRIEKYEASEFEAEIFDKFIRRSEIEWVLDLSLLAGTGLSLKKSFEEIAPNVIAGDGPRGDIEVSLVGVEITRSGGSRQGLTLY